MVNFKFWSRREIPSEDAITGTPKELTVPQEVNLTDDGGASEIFATPLEFPEDIDTDGEIVKGATSGTQQVWVDDEGKEGEEKVTDVNHCIEEIGFGRYQWKVILVMGMMSFADSCEIWLSSVIIKMLVCEWDLSTIEMALIPSCVLFFYAIGSIMSGKLADKFGRWPNLLAAYYLICISGTASAVATSYIMFIICRSLTGFGIGASYGVSVVYAQEFVPKEDRAFTGFLLNLMWILGGIYECVLAIFVMGLDNGWRIQVIGTVIPCIFTLVMLHFCEESPRYLVINGEEEKALAVVNKMCEVNNKPPVNCKLTVKHETCGEYMVVFQQPHTRTSVILTVLFLCNMWTGYGILFLVPDMMSHGYCSMSEWFDVIYITENGCINYTRAEYIFFLVITILSIPGYVVGPWTCDKLGRLITFYYSTWGGLVGTAVLLFCFGSVVIYTELFVALTFYCIFNAVLWIYTPEYYPTYIRSTAVGLVNGISKFGAAAGVLTTLIIDTVSIVYTIYTYIIIMSIAAFTTLALRNETRGTLLKDDRDSVQDNRQSYYGSIDNNEQNQEHSPSVAAGQ